MYIYFFFISTYTNPKNNHGTWKKTRKEKAKHLPKPPIFGIHVVLEGVFKHRPFLFQNLIPTPNEWTGLWSATINRGRWSHCGGGSQRRDANHKTERWQEIAWFLTYIYICIYIINIYSIFFFWCQFINFHIGNFTNKDHMHYTPAMTSFLPFVDHLSNEKSRDL